MTIEWYGLSCVALEGKGKEAQTVLFDSFTPDGKMIKRAGDAIVVLSRPLPPAVRAEFVKKHPETRLIDSAGEYDIGGVAMTVMTADWDAPHFVVSLALDGMTTVFFGGIATMPSEALLEHFDAVDVLLLSVGGGDGLHPKAAAELVRSLEPHIVIPLRYKTPSQSGYEPVSVFLKDMGKGTGSIAPEKKARLLKEDVRTSEMNIIILDDTQ
jgi:L-ascorbate metabolism protein UlaG (beta-lactamase superfamily)